VFSSIARRLRWYTTRAKVVLGIPIRTHARYEDRELLERVILPYFSEQDWFRRVLFVGCAPYTAHYRFMFRRREYTTLDIDPVNRLFGARNHLTDTVANLDHYFPPASFDLILMNGVFGWGLNDRDEAERSVEVCYQCLSPGGVLMIGWDDIPRYRPFAPQDLRSLSKFHPYVFPPFGESERLVPGELRHTFNFYAKPDSAAPADERPGPASAGDHPGGPSPEVRA
jgi:SAM-dependent methyltransferase